jgi:hypothetical protein
VACRVFRPSVVRDCRKTRRARFWRDCRSTRGVMYDSFMTLRSSFVVFGMGTMLAWGALALTILTVPPETGGIAAQLFFFAALFLALAGTLTLLGVLGRMRTSGRLASLHLTPAFRQGALIAGGAVGILLLQRVHLLRWWTVLILCGALFVTDLFLSRGGRPTTHEPA